MNFETWWNKIGLFCSYGQPDTCDQKELSEAAWNAGRAELGREIDTPPIDLATAEGALEDYRAGKWKTIDEILDEL